MKLHVWDLPLVEPPDQDKLEELVSEALEEYPDDGETAIKAAVVKVAEDPQLLMHALAQTLFPLFASRLAGSAGEEE